MTHHNSQHDWASTHDWLLDALGGSVNGPTTPMLARPNASEASLLIPLSSTAVSTSALRRGHNDRSVGERLKTTAGRLAGHLGALERVGGERIDFPMTRVVKMIQGLFGDSSLVVSIGAGPPRRNRKPVLMVLRPNGEIVGFAKVGWSDFTTELVVNEFGLLKAVDGLLPDPIRTPAPIKLMEDRGSVVAVTSALSAPEWSRPRGLTPDQIDNIARTVGFRLATVSALRWLNEPRFGTRTDDSQLRLTAAVAGVAAQFADEQLEVGLWHGDLNPWNLISTSTGVGVIDWEFGGWDRPIGQDRRHLRFESIRRDPAMDPATAVSLFVERELAGSSTPTELGVYLSDMAIRESRLSGQGWSSAMSGYRLPLTTAIEGLLT
jgi:hypothetical protein